MGPTTQTNARKREQTQTNASKVSQPAPKYHTKGCSRSSVDSPGARTLVFAAFEPFSSCEFRASIARTPFCVILWCSPKISGSLKWSQNADQRAQTRANTDEREQTQPAPKYHTKGCSRSSVDSPGARTLVFVAFEPFLGADFRVSIARTPFCAILWRSPRISGSLKWVPKRSGRPTRANASKHRRTRANVKSENFTSFYAPPFAAAPNKLQTSYSHQSASRCQGVSE